MTREINALIVDDSLTTRKLIMQALNQTGLAKFVFTESNDGMDALSKYRPGETEIIFVDLNMPRMSGTEFIRELRDQHRKCPPIVMITAESKRERLHEALHNAKVDAFLLKPVDRDRLRTGLQRLLGSIPVRSGPCIVPQGECVSLAMQEVIGKVCDLDLTPMDANQPVSSGGIVLGMLSMRGDLEWTVVLGFTRSAAVAVATRFAGHDMSYSDEDLGDAIGEITNMVSGRIRFLLSGRGIGVSTSLPAVVAATDFQILLQRKATSHHAYLGSSIGTMWTVVSAGLNPGMML